MNKIKDLFIKFDDKCMKMSDFKFTFYILGLFMLLFIITTPIDLIYIGIENLPNESLFDNRSFFELFSLVVIVGPYIETIIFHVAPLGLYCKVKERFNLNKHWDFIMGGFCGLVFGVIHAIEYPLYLLKGFDTTIIGCVYSYVFFRYRRLDKKSTYGIWIIHALNNLIAVVI